MSLKIDGEKCAVCKAYLFQDDDIVYCPECGAPHHRECYNSLGHCGLQELHGTDDQYKKTVELDPDESQDNTINMITCEICGEEYDSSEDKCPSCNAPNISKMGGRFISFDFFGGVPSNTDLGNGVTAEEAKQFVVSNTHRYIPKFLKFKQGKKISWNWLAFLVPSAWLLSRKMYLLGIVTAAVQVALSILTIPFVAATNQLDLSAARNSFEMATLIMDNMSVIGESVLYTATIGSFLNTIISVLLAIFGDYIYRNRVITKVNEIKRNNTIIDEELQKKGGVNFIAAILGYFAVSELPGIIAYAVGLLR